MGVGILGNWYQVVKVIGGHPYLYLQMSWREGDRVRTKCRCLGRLNEKPKEGRGRSNQKRQTKLVKLVAGIMVADHIKTIEDWRQLQKEQELVVGLLDPANRGQWRPGFDQRDSDGQTQIEQEKAIDGIPVKMAITVMSLPKRKTRRDVLGAYEPNPHLIKMADGKEILRIPEAGRYSNDQQATAKQKYYKSLLHECSHATGEKHRLNRQSYLDYHKKDKYRCLEEATVEMSARLTARRLGVMSDDTSASADFIQGYVGAFKMEDREKAMKIIIEQALAASDYLIRIYKSVS